MASKKIRKDDLVIVLTGKDKNKRGKVLAVDPRNDRVRVEGVNIRKRHQRPVPGVPESGGIISFEGPIHISNVDHIDPELDKPTRVRIERDGKKRLRVAVKSGKTLE